MSEHEQEKNVDFTEPMQEEQQWLRELLLRDCERFQLPDSLRSENLIHKLEKLDVTEQPTVEAREQQPQKRIKTIHLKYLSYAACLAIICFGWYSATQNVSEPMAPRACDAAAKAMSTDDEAAPEQSDTATAMFAATTVALEEQPVAENYSQVYDALTTVWKNNYAGNYSYGKTARPMGDPDGLTNPSIESPRPATGGAMNDTAIMQSSPMNPTTSNSSAGNTDGGRIYTTNVQVAGVDESDIVKTDGTYIYQYRFNTSTGGAQIAISTANGLKLLSTIELPQYADSEMYLAGNKLVVVQQVQSDVVDAITKRVGEPLSSYLAENSEGEDKSREAQASSDVIVPDYYNRKFPNYKRSLTMTEAVTYDISDHKKPKEINRYRQDGSYVSSRLANDTLYLVTNKYICGDVTVATDPVYCYLPIVGEQENVRVLPAGDIVIPPYLENLNYAVVTALDISSQATKTKAVLGMADQIMMSNSNLFLTANVRSVETKSWYDRSTGITRFSVTEGGLQYLASGKVAGYIDNQFSLDEHKGNLRIATTSYNDSGDTTNNVYVLDASLNQIGVLENLAEGERIYSVRYMGDTAYVVTFRETDPLFVIDLSNPAKPAVKGELKIPGFSEYLHPIDENTLLGLGMNTIVTKYGGVAEDGLKLSLFDVSDPTNPKEKVSYLLGNMGSTSEALENHKAFMYYPELKLVGFPATIYTTQGTTANDPWSGERTVGFAGYLVVKVNDSGFDIVGTIPNDGAESELGFMRYDSGNTIERGIYIGKTLYTTSEAKIMAFSLDTFEQIGELKY